MCVCVQEQVSESTTKTVLDKLKPDTRYTIRVVPVYAEGDGPSLTDSGKTSESTQRGQGSEVRGQHTHTPVSSCQNRWASPGTCRFWIPPPAR